MRFSGIIADFKAKSKDRGFVKSVVQGFIICLLMVTLVSLGSCSQEDNYDGKTKVIYQLEGGTYQNCKSSIIHYYGFDINTSNLIYEPQDLTENKIIREGYTLNGWYLNKNVDGDKVTYTDKWDFEQDRVTNKGITLYASWKRNPNFIYNVCYYDDQNELQILGSYTSSEPGAKFSDFANYARTRPGNYTVVEYQDENGNPWDNNFTHPGIDEDLTINVIVKYVEGNYAVVRTALELKANKNKNIYLVSDIDLKGDSFNFNDYKGIFLGNNHTISNFSINYSPRKSDLIPDFEVSDQNSLCISIFGNIDGATIKDVKFEKVTVDVNTTLTTTYKIYVAPIATSMTNATVSNVSFSGTFGYTRLPKDFNINENLIYVIDKIYYLKDNQSAIEDCLVDVTINNNED